MARHWNVTLCIQTCALACCASVCLAQRGGGADEGVTPDIITALTLGDLHSLQKVLASGADPNVVTPTFKGPVWLSSLIMGERDMFWTIARASTISVARAPSGRKGGPEALAIAAGRGYADVVTYLIERGVDVNSRLNVGVTAVLVAASNGNAEMVRMLTGRGADVNLADRHGDTPLMAAVRAGNIASVEAVLSGRANVNSADNQGRTAAWWAARSGRVDVMEALVKRGADVRLADKSGVTPLMEADVMGRANMVRYIRGNGGVGEVRYRAVRDVGTAIAAGVAQIQKGAELWSTRAKCESCHQTFPGMQATLVAERYGIALDGKLFDKQWAEYRDVVRARENQVRPTVKSRIASAKADDPSEDLSFSLATITLPEIGLEATKGDRYASIALVLANLQFADGRWIHGMARVPIESSDLLTTAYAIRTLQLHAPASERARIDQQIARAAEWMLRARPETTDDLTGSLYGVFWTNRDRATVGRAAAQLIRRQQEDGSWAQKDGMNGDAYATGSVLFALHATGQLQVTDSAFKRGIAYLLRTQEDDGSWLVPTRAIPLNGYLESGSPHGKHQFISYTGTCWSTMALIVAAGGQKPK